MSIIVEIDGVKVEAESAKDARRIVSKALKAAKKESDERSRRYHVASDRAKVAGYNILHRKADGEEFPQGWTFYAVGEKWAEHLFQPVPSHYHDGRITRHKLNVQDAYGMEWDHYGYELLGAVCNGSGFLMAVFLRDTHRPNDVSCLAVGAEQDQIALAACPGITIEMFRRSSNQE